MTFLYKSDPVRGAVWSRLFAQRSPQIAFRMWPDVGDPRDVRYIAAWTLPPGMAATFPNLEILFCVGAGVDQLDLSQVPAAIPVVRMVEPGLVEGMVEYATLAVLALHRDWLVYATHQREHRWRALPLRAAASRRVGIMGMGVMGRAIAARLAAFGFPVAGWSRSPHDAEGIETFAGSAALEPFLARTDILVCVLPLTDATRGILDARVFDALPRGAGVVNMGRGAQLVASDLVRALDAGKLSGAVLDVTDPEPLPTEHALWSHPRIAITPHVAAQTRPESAVEAVLENLRRHRRGEPLAGLVDRSRGY